METTLVGRTEELAAITRVLSALPGGGCRVLAISGEPGIGKTRLLSELRALAAAGGNIVLAGRGTELESEAPFAPLVEALDDYVGSLEPRRLQTLSERLPHLADVLPTFGALGEAQLGPATERYRHHRAIQALLEQLAGTRPLVLVLDDVHWSDAASLEAIAHLLRRPPDAPVLIVLSYRTGQEAPILSAALNAAARDGIAERLALQTLTEGQTDALLEGTPADERRRIFRESGGNPFYIDQLRRAGMAPEPPAASPGSGGDPVVRIPPAVLAAIEEELRRVPAQARRLLEGAAVAGEPFSPELAAAAAGISADTALELTDELFALGLITTEPVPRLFRFRHPIVRRAVYDSMAPGRRLATHRRAAETLGEWGAPATARAHHIAMSARPGDEAAISALIEAAQHVAATAPASTAQMLEVAVSLLPATSPAAAWS